MYIQKVQVSFASYTTLENYIYLQFAYFYIEFIDKSMMLE